MDLLRSAPAISLHDHPIRLPEPLTSESWGSWREEGREVFGYAGLRRSGLAGIFASANSWHGREELLAWADRHAREIRAEDGVRLLDSPTMIKEHFQHDWRNSIGIMLALETIDRFAEEPESIEMLVSRGFRMAGLCYDTGNSLGSGLGQINDSGLTRRGREMVAAMNESGMIIDLSHVGDRTAGEVIEASSTPVVFSHAGAQAVWPIPRLKPDDLLRRLADHGGIIGIEAAPNSTCSRQHPAHSVYSIMDHLDYLLELVGPDNIGFGPDSMFGDHTAIHRIRSKPGDVDYSYTPFESVDQVEVDFVEGVENPAENFVNLAQAMIVAGHTDEIIVKVLGGNAQRLISKVCR